MKLLFASEFPIEIVNTIDSEKLNQMKLDYELEVYKTKNGVFLVGQVLTETKDAHILIDGVLFNDYTMNVQNKDFLQKVYPIFIQAWVDYIESSTLKYKDEGLTEEEVGIKLTNIHMPENLTFNFYCVK